MQRKLNEALLTEYLRASKAAMDTTRHNSSAREQVRLSREAIDSSRALMKRLDATRAEKH